MQHFSYSAAVSTQIQIADNFTLKDVQPLKEMWKYPCVSNQHHIWHFVLTSPSQSVSWAVHGAELASRLWRRCSGDKCLSWVIDASSDLLLLWSRLQNALPILLTDHYWLKLTLKATNNNPAPTHLQSNTLYALCIQVHSMHTPTHATAPCPCCSGSLVCPAGSVCLW